MKESRLIGGAVIADVSLIKHQSRDDDRGSFVEVFQTSWNTIIQPKQWSIVKSHPQVFRGMHYHQRHEEYFCLVKGRCLVGLKDLRPDSKTYLTSSLYKLYDSDMASLCFPRGVLHGWYFYCESIHLQAVSESYATYGADDNHGCLWSDPDLNIRWPFKNARVSPRAANFPSLKELKIQLNLP